MMTAEQAKYRAKESRERNIGNRIIQKTNDGLSWLLCKKTDIDQSLENKLINNGYYVTNIDDSYKISWE